VLAQVLFKNQWDETLMHCWVVLKKNHNLPLVLQVLETSFIRDPAGNYFEMDVNMGTSAVVRGIDGIGHQLHEHADRRFCILCQGKFFVVYGLFICYIVVFKCMD